MARRPRGSLSPERIADAAAAVAAREGFGRLTVRAVAAELGAAPMALYSHFRTKDELLETVLDRVLADIDLATSPRRSWQARFVELGRRHVAALLAHRDAVPHLLEHPNPGPNATRFGEAVLAVLRDGGLPDAAAVDGFGSLLALNYGWSAFAAGGGAEPAALAAALAALPADVFPHTAAVAPLIARAAGADAHERALRRLADGLAA